MKKKSRLFERKNDCFEEAINIVNFAIRYGLEPGQKEVFENLQEDAENEASQLVAKPLYNAIYTMSPQRSLIHIQDADGNERIAYGRANELTCSNEYVVPTTHDVLVSLIGLAVMHITYDAKSGIRSQFLQRSLISANLFGGDSEVLSIISHFPSVTAQDIATLYCNNDALFRAHSTHGFTINESVLAAAMSNCNIINKFRVIRQGSLVSAKVLAMKLFADLCYGILNNERFSISENRSYPMRRITVEKRLHWGNFESMLQFTSAVGLAKEVTQKIAENCIDYNELIIPSKKIGWYHYFNTLTPDFLYKMFKSEFQHYSKCFFILNKAFIKFRQLLPKFNNDVAMIYLAYLIGDIETSDFLPGMDLTFKILFETVDGNSQFRMPSFTYIYSSTKAVNREAMLVKIQEYKYIFECVEKYLSPYYKEIDNDERWANCFGIISENKEVPKLVHVKRSFLKDYPIRKLNIFFSIENHSNHEVHDPRNQTADSVTPVGGIAECETQMVNMSRLLPKMGTEVSSYYVPENDRCNHGYTDPTGVLFLGYYNDLLHTVYYRSFYYSVNIDQVRRRIQGYKTNPSVITSSTPTDTIHLAEGEIATPFCVYTIFPPENKNTYTTIGCGINARWNQGSMNFITRTIEIVKTSSVLDENGFESFRVQNISDLLFCYPFDVIEELKGNENLESLYKKRYNNLFKTIHYEPSILLKQPFSFRSARDLRIAFLLGKANVSLLSRYTDATYYPSSLSRTLRPRDMVISNVINMVQNATTNDNYQIPKYKRLSNRYSFDFVVPPFCVNHGKIDSMAVTHILSSVGVYNGIHFAYYNKATNILTINVFLSNSAKQVKFARGSAYSLESSSDKLVEINWRSGDQSVSLGEGYQVMEFDGIIRNPLSLHYSYVIGESIKMTAFNRESALMNCFRNICIAIKEYSLGLSVTNGIQLCDIAHAVTMLQEILTRFETICSRNELLSHFMLDSSHSTFGDLQDVCDVRIPEMLNLCCNRNQSSDYSVPINCILNVIDTTLGRDETIYAYWSCSPVCEASINTDMLDRMMQGVPFLNLPNFIDSISITSQIKEWFEPKFCQLVELSVVRTLEFIAMYGDSAIGDRPVDDPAIAHYIEELYNND